MAIRITGMYSGLDTESIISELASAQSVKKNKLVKAQTKLSWKQDAWKALNTKIFSFYTNVLGNMRFEGSYMKKATKVSNSNAVSVVTSADAPNSVQTMTVNQLAKQGYMTSAVLKTSDGKKVTASTTMEELGFTGDSGSFRIKTGNKTTDITITKDMKISDVVSKLQAAGVNASFDAKNQRLYLNSKGSGAAADFTITSNDTNGQSILKNLGLVSAYNKDSSEYKEYETWAGYETDTNARQKAEADELAKLLATKKASTDSLIAANKDLEKRMEDLLEASKDGGYDKLFENSYDPSKSRQENVDALNDQVEEYLTALYGAKKMDVNGDPELDADGNFVREGGIQKQIEDAQKALKDAQDALEEAKNSGTATDDEIKQKEEAVNTASSTLTDLQTDFNKKNSEYSWVRGAANIQNALLANEKTIENNRTYYKTDANGDPELDANGKLQVSDANPGADEIGKYFDKKIEAAKAYLKDAEDYENKYNSADDAEKAVLASQYATKIDGRDAQITLNGVTYTNNKNTFEINGLTITAQQETAPGEEITLTTAEDTDGIYDMIKNFFTEYNKLINEMDALYNADSSKGYEPLLSEEKQGLADSEIEEWEKKIKDSLLRRDSTLRDVTDAMKTVMLQGTTVNSRKMYLSDFGINTLGFFNAADNEKGAYHINGDKDDATVANEDDTLRAMIAADPTSVQKFFAGLSKNLYDTLTDKMKSVKDTSSAFTVYNDKTMQKEYDDYKDKIAKEETKLNNLIDSWYSKFSAMETAMAKLQSKNNAVSSMFGG